MVGTEGTFTSPNFPDVYPSGITCTYIVDTQQDSMISIFFKILSLEDGYDFLYIGYGNEANNEDATDVLTGVQFPSDVNPIEVQGRFVWFRIVTDASRSDAGFLLQWAARRMLFLKYYQNLLKSFKLEFLAKINQTKPNQVTP